MTDHPKCVGGLHIDAGSGSGFGFGFDAVWQGLLQAAHIERQQQLSRMGFT